MATIDHPIEILERASLSRLQIFVVGITVFLNALDGFDLLSISFAAPGIAAEWNVSRAALGIVLSMELIGMGIGALLLGGIADKIGRRSSAIWCLTLMLIGMLGAVLVTGVLGLSICRIFTGVGLGGMLATNNAIVAEFTNARRRKFCIALMVIGFSLGGVLGGAIASYLLAHFDWRSVFYFGATITAACIPLVYFYVPESVHWLVRKQPRNALERVNVTLNRMGHGSVRQLPTLATGKERGSPADIFAPELRRDTILITLVYLLHALTFYFVLKWAPKIVVDLGYHPSTAGTVLVWANVGGVLGGILFGLLSQQFKLKTLFVVVLLFSSLTVIAFGHTATSITALSFFCALNGFFCVSALVGSYAAMAQIYPTHVRGFGTGFTLSLGRGGAILSPIVAGLLFDIDLGLLSVSIVMAAGSALAALVLLNLKLSSTMTPPEVIKAPHD